MAPDGQRTKRLAHQFETQHQAGQPSGGAKKRADEAAADIGRSPIPVLKEGALDRKQPTVPPRPERFRAVEHAQRPQNPPLSPENAFRRHGEEQSPGQSLLQRAERLPSPKETGISMLVSTTNDSSSSSSDLENELSSIKDEIRNLRSELKDRNAAIASLRYDHDEAIKKYDKAISDLQMSQSEKNGLQDQLQRLRDELSQEREKRAGLEADIETRVKREETLLDMLERRREIGEGRVTESREPAKSIEPQMPARDQRERRTKARRTIKIYTKPESRVKFRRFFSKG